MPDPFHAGERSVQEATGERHTAVLNGQAIADRVPAAARSFVRQQHLCLLGGAAPEGEIWAILAGGPQGFATTDESCESLTLQLEDPRGLLAHRPLLETLVEGDRLGVLFIELTTRRRLRVNGRCERWDAGELVIRVEQAHALCPKYIQRRELREREPLPGPPLLTAGRSLSPAVVDWITRADTFFVASAGPGGAADVSHRGGRPGFVRHQDGVLRIPDYPGNSMFATLGNFAINPRAGLVFVDFDADRMLQLTGEAELQLNGDGSSAETAGTGRWWCFRPQRWVVSPLNRSFSATSADPSPFNP